MSSENGKLIVCVGLPGSGKTSLFQELSKITGREAWVEPEEESWDKAVTKRDRYGHIGGLHWFRSQRVPNLIDARACADDGNIVLLDTFYDKICCYYLGKPGLEWLLSPEDKYYDNFLETAKLDLENLPDADVVILIQVDKLDWTKMLGARGRKLDKMVKLSETYETQDLFSNAARQYCLDRNSTLIEFKNVFSTVSDSVNSLHNLLKTNGIML